MVTKGDYEYRKEQKQQQINDIDLQIQDQKIAQKRHNLSAEKIKTDTAKVNVAGARIALSQTQTNNAIAHEKLTQSKDSLSYEKGMTRLNREQLLTSANQAMMTLNTAKKELEESRKLFSLKFKSVPQSINLNNTLK